MSKRKPTQDVQEVVETNVQTKITEQVEPTYGVVKCERLNIRKRPDKNSEVVRIVTADTELSIDRTNSNNDWYKVSTSDGLNGFCMRKFIRIVK